MITKRETSGPLCLAVYAPGEEAIFQASSTLITGKDEAILVDAQFASNDAQALIELVRESGRELGAIYVSYGDPDFYFGLDVLREAFPNVRVMASQPTIDHIWSTRDSKLKTWRPRLGEDAPERIVMPELASCRTLELEGVNLQIIGLDGPTPERSFIWIEEAKTVLGGIPVFSGLHVWMADTQTPESREHWLKTLESIRALKPEIVVPGHRLPDSPLNMEAVDFTEAYLLAYDEEASRAGNSRELIDAMKKRFPGLAGLANLELSAKVSKGEMDWS